jgi:hypothetical protein
VSRFHVTRHAVDRYIQRVAPVTPTEARQRLEATERAVLAAASIGCTSVRLGCGARLALAGAKITTVYGADMPRNHGPRCTRLHRGLGR